MIDRDQVAYTEEFPPTEYRVVDAFITMLERFGIQEVKYVQYYQLVHYLNRLRPIQKVEK